MFTIIILNYNSYNAKNNWIISTQPSGVILCTVGRFKFKMLKFINIINSQRVRSKKFKKVSRPFLKNITNLFLKNVFRRILKSISQLPLKNVSCLLLKKFSQLFLKNISQPSLKSVSQMFFKNVQKAHTRRWLLLIKKWLQTVWTY